MKSDTKANAAVGLPTAAFLSERTFLFYPPLRYNVHCKEEFFMEKYITDERTGLKYELVGDYYLIAGDDEPVEKQKPIGIWGHRHHEYLRRNKQITLSSLQISGKLNGYLADIDQQAEEMFERLTRQMAVAEDITEQLKATDQMAWVGKMNNIRNAAMEIVNAELIYS